MATPRSRLVSSEVPLYYHITSGCAQKAWLLGRDPKTGKNYSHRRKWIIDRFKSLGRYFTVEVCAYAIMSNHFHLVVYFDPLAARRWSDEEVAHRWSNLCPPVVNGVVDEGLKELMVEELLDNAEELRRVRAELGNLSTFMKHLKQQISTRANKEVDKSGCFWAERFYSGVLLDQEAVLAAMAYVDLNPIRARIAENLNDCVDTSLHERLAHARHDPAKLEKYLDAIVSGLDQQTVDVPPNIRVKISLSSYLKRLACIIAKPELPIADPIDKQSMWIMQMSCIGKKQRAYGNSEHLRVWQKLRKLRPLERALDGKSQSADAVHHAGPWNS